MPWPGAESELCLGWIGTGVMGLPMARHLQQHGPWRRFLVYNRTPAKAQSLIDAGAEFVASPAAMRGAGVHVVFTMVGYPTDLENIVFNKDTGLLAGEDKYPVPYLVDMSTSTPELAERVAAAFEQRGSAALDAPVSGGDVGAKERRLSIMVGGPADLFERMRPLLRRMSKVNIGYMGGPGRGQHTKMTNQIVIASGMTGVCEGLLYAHSAGLDVEQLLETIGSGAAGSFSLQVLAPRIVRGDFRPGFRVDHFVKDLGIALEESKKMNLTFPGLKLAHDLYSSLAKEHGAKGTQSLILALEELNQKRIFFPPN